MSQEASPAPVARRRAPRGPGVRIGAGPLLLAAVGIAAFGAGGLTGAYLHAARARARDLVVAVNGAPISRQHLMRRMETWNVEGATVGDRAILSLVNDELWLQFAASRGVAPTNEEVELEFAEARQAPDFSAKLARSRKTLNEVRRAIRVALAQYKVLTRGVKATEADARRFYQANINPANPRARWVTPETIRISAVFTRDRAQADRARALLDTGAPFSEVVERYSVDEASRATGGQLPDVVRGRVKARIPGLDEIVFGMRSGDTIGPIRVADHWVILRCRERIPQQVVPYEQVRRSAMQGAVMLAAGERPQKVLQEFARFRQDAKLQAFWRHYEPALVLGR